MDTLSYSDESLVRYKITHAIGKKSTMTQNQHQPKVHEMDRYNHIGRLCDVGDFNHNERASKGSWTILKVTGDILHFGNDNQCVSGR